MGLGILCMIINSTFLSQSFLEGQCIDDFSFSYNLELLAYTRTASQEEVSPRGPPSTAVLSWEKTSFHQACSVLQCRIWEIQNDWWEHLAQTQRLSCGQTTATTQGSTKLWKLCMAPPTKSRVPCAAPTVRSFSQTRPPSSPAGPNTFKHSSVQTALSETQEFSTFVERKRKRKRVESRTRTSWRLVWNAFQWFA